MSAWHRPLGDMLLDVSAAVDTARTDLVEVRARKVELTLPIEIEFRDVGGETVFIADLPVWRLRTVFDQTPSRMTITWEERAL